MERRLNTVERKIKELSTEIEKLKELYDSLSKHLKAKAREQARVGAALVLGKGKAETSLALRKVQQDLLTTGFFRKPKTTNETRTELKRKTGVTFQSRKVSQALGVLHKKGVLTRMGSKGSYRYIEAKT